MNGKYKGLHYPFSWRGKPLYYVLKCQRLFRPQFRKVNPSFVAQIRQVLDTLMLNVDVSDDTRV